MGFMMRHINGLVFGEVVISSYRRVTIVLCAAAFGVMTLHSFGQKFVWRERSPLTVARAGYMAGAIHGKYVIAGGSYWVDKHKKWTDEVDIYDPTRDRWERLANLPQARSDAASVALDNELYVFGGGADVEIRRDALVFRDGKWHPIPSAELPEPRVYAVAVVNRGLIYVMGGMSKHDDYTSLSNKVWVWNPRTPEKGWKELQSFPGPGLITAAVAALDGRIYILGGAKHGGTDVVNVDTAFSFDPKSGVWITLPALPLKRRCWWGLTVAPEILLFGGYTSTNESDIFSYNPAARSLTKIGKMPHGLCDAKFLHINGSIYGVGGESASGIRGRWTLETQLPKKTMVVATGK